MGMGKEQRDAIRRALNEDAGKLIQEGDPGDSQLRRLRREIDEVNALFEEFERLAAEGESTAGGGGGSRVREEEWRLVMEGESIGALGDRAGREAGGQELRDGR